MIIHIDNNPIEQVKSTEFIGVIINENVTWTDYLNILISKVSKGIGVIRRLSRIMPADVLRSLYVSLIHPYFEYCNIAWDSCRSSLLNKLFICQKKAIRLITCSKWNSHTSPLFKSNNILKVFDLPVLQVGSFMYKGMKNLLPAAFTNFVC